MIPGPCGFLDKNVIIVLFMDLNGGKEAISILITVGNARKLLVTGGILPVTHDQSKVKSHWSLKGAGRKKVR
jgi:hypothetical protein